MTESPRAADLSLREQVRLLSGHDEWRTERAGGLRPAMLSDGPHGLRVQPEGGDHLSFGDSIPATCFPTAVTLACTWDDDLAREVGAAIGLEARALGVDVVLGPGLNIKRHPLGGRNFEYFSEDPLLGGHLAAAVVEGIQSQGVGACLKHFAVNNQESHRFVVDAVVDERTLRELYLAGFEYAVRASWPWTVMASYNSVNGVHATEHHDLLTTILRDEWGFDGLVMSDWGAVSDRVRGIAAGMDLEMPSSRGLFDQAVREAVENGTLPAEAVTTSAQRVLDLLARCPQGDRPEGDRAELLVDDHDALARRVAAEATVVLQNDGLLPLDPGLTVALLGDFADRPRYQGSGSSLVTPTRLTSARAAFSARGIEVTDDPAAADVAVVLVGLPGTHESEGFDRSGLALPPEHDALVEAAYAANPRTVVVLSAGGPVRLPWRERVPAVLTGHLGGQATGAALVDVLYGDVEPAGRLAESWPAELGDVASDPWFPGEPHQVEHREGLFVGYRHHVTADVAPAYPFGHGRGYTRLDWSDPALDRTNLTAGEPLRVTVTVANPGDRPGSDVVQVYLHDQTGVVLRPRRELAAYARVRLEPGESRAITLEVPARAFAFYDVERADWSIPSGRYAVEVARSSAEIVAALPVQVVGGVESAPEPADTARLAVDDAAFARRLGRPVPVPRPVRPFTRESTVGELATTRTGRLLRRALVAAAPLDQAAGDDETLKLMLARSLEELPLRSVASFSGGRLPWPAVDAILAVVNGRPWEVATAAAQRARTRWKLRPPRA
ncbi:glycoside hydrolase family 3 N-terminal domain-containing protein [Nocardioides sp. W7]|uniref:glycoside hydrolase family 3 C-terminal domain-containing protein n=1 Tax=Nocardioides sp. W7 TaxID=2931390 RepID=UPI001FD52A9E|nr:glycoside hydrolase family 3 N-terminal domain-containing protein [Nocardioides sp. W7]